MIIPKLSQHHRRRRRRQQQQQQQQQQQTTNHKQSNNIGEQGLKFLHIHKIVKATLIYICISNNKDSPFIDWPLSL